MKVEITQNIDVRELRAPASKSYAQRAILASCLSEGTSRISHVGKSNDVLNIIEVARQLGAKVSGDNNLRIHGRVFPPKMVLNCGESGLGIRLSTFVAAAIGGEFDLIGAGSLENRPMTDLAEILPQIGIEFKAQNNRIPIHINGQIQGGKITIDGSSSSQYLSGLLMALPLAGQHSEVEVTNLNSIPYIEMTLDLMSQFGVEVSHQNFKTFKIRGNQTYTGTDYTVEGDWSGAAFWVVYGALKGPVKITGLNPHSLQADREILSVIESSGGKYEWIDQDLHIFRSILNPFTFDATNCPDLFPALVVLAAGINGESQITGVERLKHKESDRGAVLKKEFNKLGLDIQIDGNKMKVSGTGSLMSNEIDSHNDHRIAMAASISAILTPDGVSINDAEAVNKSYPEFWDQFQNL